ncbi:MAG: hypothetical protein HETSPECPRED_000171 [Heterodermia speciosa]|uniref:DUF1754-domain-containing protein n=1 Tax=Heterodermia speciosa TaxID=116794 RepID=A0A8H3EEL7_9LECA|nr:MAG: hypothetical protein HETSPECPRED_000171 [Heterodermia speciosa]
MPADEYATATAGSLKLKGVNPSSKVSKSHKKKKKKKPKAEKPSSSSNLEESTEHGLDDPLKAIGDPETVEEDALARTESEKQIEEELEAEITARGRGKTEAELRHEEHRRRRLDERLKREGTKTHKERVEELNRYLSNLSEHHDMPRIGPG